MKKIILSILLFSQLRSFAQSGYETTVTITSENTDGVTVADAILFVPEK